MLKAVGSSAVYPPAFLKETYSDSPIFWFGHLQEAFIHIYYFLSFFFLCFFFFCLFLITMSLPSVCLKTKQKRSGSQPLAFLKAADCGHSKTIIDLPFGIFGVKIESVLIPANCWVQEASFTQWAILAGCRKGIWRTARKGTFAVASSFCADIPSWTHVLTQILLNCQNVVAIQKLIWLWMYTDLYFLT